MSDFSIRRRLLKDGEAEHEVEELLNEMAEQRNDEARDLAAEEFFYKKQP